MTPHRLKETIRLLPLVVSVLRRHVANDPIRTAVLAHRVAPRKLKEPLQRELLGDGRRGGPLLRALTLWDRGHRDEALDLVTEVTEHAHRGVVGVRVPRRLAAFALAVDRPDVAAVAVDALPDTDPRRSRLLALVAWQHGEYHAALDHLDGVTLRGARRTRRQMVAELAVLSPDWSGPGPRYEGGYTPVPGRVLHVVTNALPHKHAGYTVRTQRIAAAQRAGGLDAHVMTQIGFPVAQGVLDARQTDVRERVIYHRLLPWTLPRAPDTAVALGVEMAAGLVARLRPAVLHAASNHINGQTALALRERFDLPVVYEVRGFLEETWLSRDADRAEHGATSDLYRLSRELETHCMRSADLVVTLGEVMKDEIVSRGVPEELVHVVPNAVDDEFLAPLPDGDDLRESLGIGAGEVVAGVVSSLFAYEGLDTLLHAGAELRRRGTPVRLLIVGDGPERAALQRLARQLDLGDAAIFTGRVPFERVRLYHAVLDIFVVPRTDDRVCHMVTPLKPVEAMASGIPVVASNVTALREIIEPNVTGKLTIPEDSASLAATLEELVYSFEWRVELGTNAREWVRQDRTWQCNTQRYMRAYRALGAI